MDQKRPFGKALCEGDKALVLVSSGGRMAGGEDEEDGREEKMSPCGTMEET